MKRVETMMRFQWETYVLFGVLLTIVGALYFLPTIFPSFIGTGYISIAMLMSLISLIIWRYQIITPRAALAIGLILCLSLMPLLPYTSNDTQRYFWDGAVFLSGVDPYLTAPNDPIVSKLRQIWPTPEEHAQYPTLYPPGGLLLFSICSLAGPNGAIWIWKILTTLALGLTLIFTYKLLESRNAGRHFYLVAFSPLLLFEAQAGAHLDIFCALGIVAAILCIEKDKLVIAGLIVGLAATTKFLPAIIVGPYIFYLRPRQAFKLVLSSAITWLSIYALMFGLGYKPLGLLPTFFEKWRGGAPLYPILEHIKSWLSLSNRNFLFALIGLAILGFTSSAWLARKRKIEIAVMISLSVPLLLSPVLFPWYLLALVPLLALRPSLTLFTAITFAPLSYVVLNKWLSEGIWQQAAWPATLLLISLIISLIFDLNNRTYFQNRNS